MEMMNWWDKHGTLGDTVGHWGGGGFKVVYGNEQL